MNSAVWMVRPHFSSRELECPCCGLLLQDARALDALEALRVAIGHPLRVTSGTRCPSHNLNVGGVPNSGHLTGKAFDLIPLAGLLGTSARAAKRVGFRQAIIYQDDRHLHVGV